MKIWVDDICSAPEGFVWCTSVKETLQYIISEYEICVMRNELPLELILDLDCDAGKYFSDGGDYIEILKEIEKINHLRIKHKKPESYQISPTIHIHSMNVVGAEDMRRIIQKKRMEGDSMKKLLLVGFCIATLLSGCYTLEDAEKDKNSVIGGYPQIKYCQTQKYNDIHNRVFEVPSGYILDPGHAYDLVTTESGIDMVFHLVEEKD